MENAGKTLKKQGTQPRTPPKKCAKKNANLIPRPYIYIYSYIIHNYTFSLLLRTMDTAWKVLIHAIIHP
jgi:hypothetical protein